MKYLSIVLFLSYVFSASAIAKTITINKWVDITNDVLPELKPLKSECKRIELTEDSKKSYLPEFPSQALGLGKQGYSILEFTIDVSGKTLITETIASTDKIFEKQSVRYLKKLKFVTRNDWNSTCADQVYRIGYAFRILTDCSGKEFQKPIINVCTVGMIAYLQGGKWIDVNVVEK